MNYSTKRVFVRLLLSILGRRNLVRLGRFLSNEGRYDVPNALSSNGELDMQRRVLAKGSGTDALIVFDVGANVGEWTTAFLNANRPFGRSVAIHAFEPCVPTRLTLERNLAEHGFSSSVRVSPCALSSRVEERAFYAAGDNLGTNSLFPTFQVHLGRQIVTSIQTDTVDNYCDNNAVAHIDLMKVDTEGNDFSVLLGAERLLSDGALDIVQFEYNHRWIQSRHYLRDVFEFVAPMGYDVGKVTPRGIEFYKGWDPELETFREGNYLVVHPDYRSLFVQIPWWKDAK